MLELWEDIPSSAGHNRLEQAQTALEDRITSDTQRSLAENKSRGRPY